MNGKLEKILSSLKYVGKKTITPLAAAVAAVGLATCLYAGKADAQGKKYNLQNPDGGVAATQPVKKKAAAKKGGKVVCPNGTEVPCPPDSRAKPKCDNKHLSLCKTEAECKPAGGHFYDGKCHSQPKGKAGARKVVRKVTPVCGTDYNVTIDGKIVNLRFYKCLEPWAAGAMGLDRKAGIEGRKYIDDIFKRCKGQKTLCYDATKTEAACKSIKLHWYDANGDGKATCNEKPKPKPKCDSKHLTLCKKVEDCEKAGGHFYDANNDGKETCNAKPKPEPKPTCDADNLDLCNTIRDCEDAGGYPYDGKCNAEPKVKPEPPKPPKPRIITPKEFNPFITSKPGKKGALIEFGYGKSRIDIQEGTMGEAMRVDFSTFNILGKYRHVVQSGKWAFFPEVVFNYEGISANQESIEGHEFWLGAGGGVNYNNVLEASANVQFLLANRGRLHTQLPGGLGTLHSEHNYVDAVKLNAEVRLAVEELALEIGISYESMGQNQFNSLNGASLSTASSDLERYALDLAAKYQVSDLLGPLAMLGVKGYSFELEDGSRKDHHHFTVSLGNDFKLSERVMLRAVPFIYESQTGQHGVSVGFYVGKNKDLYFGALYLPGESTKRKNQEVPIFQAVFKGSF